MHSDPRPGPAAGAVRPGARPRAARALAAAALAALAAAARPRHAPPLPPIVFVSRRAPAGADAGQIPGLGPHGSRLFTGGRLMLRRPDGRVRPLLPAGALADAQDPDVSFDARWIAFSGRAAPDSAWRIYRVRVDGRGLAAVTGPGDGPGDDFDPRWVNDQIVFVSTRTGAPPALY